MTSNTLAPIIVDTSALVSFLVDTDSNHSRAIDALDKYEFQISVVAIPNDVFTECINVLGRKLGHEVAYNGAQKIINSPIFQIVDTSENLRQSALSMFQDQPDSVSFTDCLVMALADLWESKLIFGFDEVFKKNGYQTPS